MHGKVDDKGQARLRVELDSVSTDIPLRDERIREHLFETKRFAEPGDHPARPGADRRAGRRRATGNAPAGDRQPARQAQELRQRPVGDPPGRASLPGGDPVAAGAGRRRLRPRLRHRDLRKLAGAGSIGLSVPVGAVLIFTSPVSGPVFPWRSDNRFALSNDARSRFFRACCWPSRRRSGASSWACPGGRRALRKTVLVACWMPAAGALAVRCLFDGFGCLGLGSAWINLRRAEAANCGCTTRCAGS